MSCRVVSCRVVSCHAPSALCAAYTPDSAAINPGALVAGLAGVVERRGVSIYEGTRVESVEGGLVKTENGGPYVPCRT